MDKRITHTPTSRPYEYNVQRRFTNYRFILYLCLGAISLLFIVLSLLYVFSKPFSKDARLELPWIFFVNLSMLVLSGVSLSMTQKAFKNDHIDNFKFYLLATAGLGILFLIGQVWGVMLLDQRGYDLVHHNAASYMWVIAGMHGLHLVGGLAFLAWYIFSSFKYLETYALSPVLFSDPAKKLQLKLFAIFWHFMGIIWVYLLAFFVILR